MATLSVKGLMWIWVRGHRRSSRLVLFYSLPVCSY